MMLFPTSIDSTYQLPTLALKHWIMPAAIAASILSVPAIAIPSTATIPLAPEPPASSPLSSEQSDEFDSNYVLGPGDQIEIDVYGYEEFTDSEVIMPDGTITISLIGDIEAAGRTLSQLQDEIYLQLNVILVEPAVTVSLATLRPVVVTIAGEVERPGPVELRSLTRAESENNNNNPDASLEAMPILSSALMEAGGVTNDADIRRVQIRRSLPNGDVTTKVINLWDAIWSENIVEDPILQDGDAVFVPPVPENNPLDRRLLAQSSLAPDTIRVRVVGQVTAPGEIAIAPDATLSSAIATAGGPTIDASLERVELVRLTEEGIIERQRIDLDNLVDDFQVEDGDVLFVPRRRAYAALDVFGRIFSPFSSIVNLINRF